MESSHGGSVKILDEPYDNTNLHQVEDIDVFTTPCGSCEGCSVAEDCGTRCENCVQNYIQTHIENNTNPNILPCLKRMCHARNLDLKGETLIVRDNSIKDEQEMEPNKNETKINEILIVEKDNTVTIQPIQNEMESKTKSNETVEMKEISRSMEHGETGFKKTIQWDESSSEDNLVISEGGNDGREASNVEMCGNCLGCTTDCGDCWTCIQREIVATKDLTPKMICQNKKCLSVKEGIEDEIKKNDHDKVKHYRRKRCGTCPGCVVAENCGNCGPCVRRQKTMIEGRKFKGVCNARKCHALKIKIGKRCGECEGCQSQSCGTCSVCVGINKNLCPLRRCHNKMDELNSKPFQSNKFYGDGIKIKSKLSKPDKIIDKKKAGMDDDLTSEDDRMANDSLKDVDHLTLDQMSKLTEVDKWLNKNVRFEENLYTDEKNEKKHDLGTNTSSKLPNPKTLKRTKKCGECSRCQAEDCGHCRSCEINHQFSYSLVLGKVPCLTNSCEFPVELTGDMDSVSLMSLQDDSSNGTVCPVKIVNGVLYDFRCFFCKKLPRVGSVNRSELMRHYSTNHYAKELKEDYELLMVDGHCLLCDIKTSSTSISSHIGQKHNEVVNYLPPEAVALCPKLIQKEQKGGRHPRAAAAGLAEILDWPEVPKGFDPSSKDRNWKGNTSSDSSKEIEIEDIEIVDGWIIEHVTNSDEELPLGNDPTLDYSGVGGRCNVCQREFDEVTDAALHLHDDHDIKGGSSYLMKDCQNFIKSGFIQVSKVQNEILPSTIHNKVDENVTSFNSDDYLDFEAKRYVAKKATSRKSRSSSTLLKEQLTRWNSQHSSSNDEETSAQCDEVGMALLPATIHDKPDENSKPSRNVARKSTSQKSWPSSTLLKEQIFGGNSQHSSKNDDETPAHCDEIEMEFLPATIHDKDDEKSTPSRNVARKSTGQKSWSSTTMKEQNTLANFQHDLFK